MDRVGRGCVLVLAMLVSPAAAKAVEWDKAQTVTVATSEFKFAPNELTFRRGVPYRLHLENRGKEEHEFTAPAFIKTLRIRNAKVLNADRTEVVLQPGEAKDFYFVPQKAGHYPLVCADHDWAGMTGKITVE
jgi:uncharacterized cupredoxin-like copper-binding protein